MKNSNKLNDNSFHEQLKSINSGKYTNLKKSQNNIDYPAAEIKKSQKVVENQIIEYPDKELNKSKQISGYVDSGETNAQTRSDLNINNDNDALNNSYFESNNNKQDLVKMSDFRKDALLEEFFKKVEC